MTENTEHEVHPLDDVYLVKWPRLLVTGDAVTEEQANEIIVRTTSLWYIGTNDREWESEVVRIFGIPPEFEHPFYRLPTDERMVLINERQAKLDARQRALRTLDLQYLSNDRVASNYIGGPHGWVDWDGAIGCSSYNIGKWPSAGEVDADLKLIAEAFPFLRMTVQLVNDSYDGEDYVMDDFAPITWVVANGQVSSSVGRHELLRPPTEDMDEEAFTRRFSDPHGERGVSAERLAAAVAQVEETYANREDEDGDE